jgi:hypothetical protein
VNTRISLVAALLLSLSNAGHADPGAFNDVEEKPEVAWKEDDFAFPPLPKEENLVEYYVSATARAKYYIDWTSILTGSADQVVRYVTVVKTDGGARNVSFEGVRCDTSETRLYATANSEGVWSKARRSEWRRVNQERSPQQYSLNYLYFCPDFMPIKTREEGRSALQNGGHPLVKQRYY